MKSAWLIERHVERQIEQDRAKENRHRADQRAPAPGAPESRVAQSAAGEIARSERQDRDAPW